MIELKTVFSFKYGDEQMGYNTKQQEIILSCLKQSHGEHMTADDIYLCLKENGNPVGKTTVYRHLEKLTEQGVIRRFTIGDSSSACYQYAGDSKCCDHYHLKCSSCGKLIHIECEFLDELAKHIYDDHKFILDGSKTVLYGLCEDCAGKEKQ